MTSIASTIASENRASADAFDARAGLIAAGESVRFATPRFALPWALAMIVVGLVTLAACILIPLREENRQLAYEQANLQAEADYVKAQADANTEFVDRVHTDPALAERLVMRATRRPMAGKQFLEFETASKFSSSPYALTKIDAPPAPAEYKSDLPPAIVGLFNDNRGRVTLMAASLFLVASAVVLGGRKNEEVQSSE